MGLRQRPEAETRASSAPDDDPDGGQGPARPGRDPDDDRFGDGSHRTVTVRTAGR